MLRGRITRWTPWLWWAAVLVTALAALALSWRNRALVSPWETGAALLSVLAYGTPGALIATRRRGNRIGWIFLGVAAVLSAHMLSAQFAVYTLRVALRVTPLAIGAAWLQNWISILPFYLVALFVVIYPDGRLPSRRWALPLVGGSIFWTMLIAGAMFLPEPLAFHPLWSDESVLLLVQNPLARAVPAVPLLDDVTWSGAFFLFVITLLSPYFRYRRADDMTRRQIRWLMFLASLLVVAYLLAGVITTFIAALPAFIDPLLIVLLGFPLAVSAAILRHNLYGLDVVINRTLVYGALTGTLGLVYVTSVVALQLLLPERTALATALSTLTVAALFNPLRGRLQAWIDRRFYRRKYDAALALAHFAAQARDEVDLDRLAVALVAVVEETVQPRGVWLWLAPAR